MRSPGVFYLLQGQIFDKESPVSPGVQRKLSYMDQSTRLKRGHPLSVQNVPSSIPLRLYLFLCHFFVTLSFIFVLVYPGLFLLLYFRLSFSINLRIWRVCVLNIFPCLPLSFMYYGIEILIFLLKRNEDL